MKHFQWLLTAAALLAAALTLTSCLGDSNVKIGAIIPVEGNMKEYGYQIRSGIQMALDEIQQKQQLTGEDGLKRSYTLVLKNEPDDIEGVKQAFNELKKEGVNAIIGAVSSDATLALTPLANEAQIILLSPASSSPEINEGQGDFVFRNQPADTLEAQQLANVIFQKCRMQKVLMVRSRNAYGEGITFEMLRNGRQNSSQIPNKVVKFNEEATQADIQTAVDEIVEINPEAIFMAAYTNDLIPLIREIRARAELSQLYLFTSSSFLPEIAITELGKEIVEGVMYTAYPWDPKESRPEIQKFATVFEEKFKAQPDIYALNGYEALHILVEAFEISQHLLPDEVRGELNKLVYKGLMGDLDFNKRGDVTRIPTVYRMVDGRKVKLTNEDTEAIKRDILTRI